MSLSQNNKFRISREAIYIFVLAAIQFSHIVDFVILMPLGPSLMKDLSITPLEFGGLVSSYTYASGISGLFFSMITDQFDRKLLLNIAFGLFIIGTLQCYFAESFLTLLFGRIVAGTFGGVLTTQVFSITSDLIPYERRGRAMGTIMSSFSLASVLGVPLGLFFGDQFGWQASFLFIVIFSLFVFALSLKCLPSLRGHLNQQENGSSSLKRLKNILLKREYIPAYLFIFILGSSTFMVIPFLSPYAVKNIGIRVDYIKYMYMVAGAVTVISARLFGVMTDKVGPAKMFFILALISLLPIYLYTSASPINFILYLALGSFFMSFVSGRMIPGMTLLTGVADAQDRGAYLGLVNSVRSFGSATATLIGGTIIVESEGKLVNFDKVGLLSICFVIISIFLALKLIPQTKTSEGAISEGH